MEHDAYKVFREYYVPPGTPEYTVERALTTEEMLEYSLKSLNEVFAEAFKEV